MKRISSVPYLNSVPLTYGIEEETSFVVPSKLAELLRAGELDAALVSITEVLFHEGYDVLDGVAVASHGPVKSVFLAHRQPLKEIQTIHCDTASLTSVNLLRVLLAERSLAPTFEPLPNYAHAAELENVLLTPHCSGHSRESAQNMAMVASDIIKVLQGQKPDYPVNDPRNARQVTS